MKTLITCHSNADLDAFSGMIAAGFLYPGAKLLFPGTQESGLAEIFSGLDKEKYGFVDISAIDWREYDRLILIDTRQTSRLRHAAPLLKRKNIKIEVWDHHPASADDLEASLENISRTGAVTSAICKELQRKNISISADDATLLGLGVYGDTGSFTYSSTTRDDLEAAAWLLDQGMDVSKITDMACHDLTSLHVSALNKLLESAKIYMINNVPVALAEASMEHYLGDFANLANKMIEMEKFEVLFAIGIMGDRIQVVARSRNNKINAGKICALLGGGGHAFAASASVKGKMITEVRETIIRGLHAQVSPQSRASEYMSTPPIGVEKDAALRQADELMLHFGLKAVPVFEPGTRVCVGLLDAQIAARATSHGLGEEPVQEYMQRRVYTLPPEASIFDLTQIIIGNRQRLVPIVENGVTQGVFTRTDLINLFASESGNIFARQKPDGKTKNIANYINERLPAETKRILRLAGEIGGKKGLPVYAVGGFARDLLMNRPNHDIDLVAEGNGIAVARALAQELGGRVREHEEFLTSVVIYHDPEGVERRIDVATARLEYYEYPAALPTVELSSIKMDLFRRDFSINCMAVRLDSNHFGELIDFFGSQRDIKDRLIRVLHTLSFVEDPTRCLRAVRFEQRYNFKLGQGTEKLLRNILPMRLLEKLSPQRLFNEFRLICEEENSAECILRLDDLGILGALGGHFQLIPSRKALVKRMKEILDWYRLLFFEEKINPWICYFLTLSHNLGYVEVKENFDALGLPHPKKKEILRQRELLKQLKPKLLRWQKDFDKGCAQVSQLCEYLRPLSLESLLFGLAYFKSQGLEKNISLYITQWRREKPDINGDDIKRLGVKPGPAYTELLKKALIAKLDGKAPTAKSQLALVMKEIKNLPEAGKKESA